MQSVEGSNTSKVKLDYFVSGLVTPITSELQNISDLVTAIRKGIEETIGSSISLSSTTIATLVPLAPNKNPSSSVFVKAHCLRP